MFNVNNQNLFKLYILIFLSYLIILASNNYPNIFDNPSGFSDQIQYYKIYLSAPQLSINDVADNQAQRFFFMYIVGSITELLQVKDYYHLIFIIINIVLHLFIIFFFIKILNYLKIKKNLIFFLTSIIIFNPYLFRSSLYAPLMMNDMSLILGILLISFYFINLKMKYLLVGIGLCALSRQTSMAIMPALIFFIFFNEKKDNIFVILAIFLNIFLFFLTKNIASEFSNINNNNLIKSISGLFTDNYSITEFTYFLAEIFVGNFAVVVLLIILFFNFKNNIKNINYKTIAIFLLALGVFSQPILGGPVFSLGNVSRLTVLALPLFLILFSIISKNVNLNFVENPIWFIMLILASLHHNYSKVPMIANYEYFLIIISIFLFKIFLIFKFKRR
jgi:hypothetical protein